MERMHNGASSKSHGERFQEFFQWIESRGATLHPSISLQQICGSNEGNGIIGTTDIPKDTTLFTLPRPESSSNSPLLTVETSQLLSFLNPQDRKRISKNWLPLVLVLIWERVRALSSPSASNSWAPYLDTLPVEFDTLMFWNPDELKELTGSTILKKIGKEEAEKDYETIIKPIIESRADLFPVPEGTKWEENYGLSVYHRMGSLILSRSFHVEPSAQKGHTDDDQDVSMNTASDLVESINDSISLEQIHEELDEEIVLDDDEDDNEREPMEHIAMLPLADLLNAKSGSENAKLFYEHDSLRMKTTKKINQGEQIYNTYGNPPNADLLRRYGHVDDPNRFDVVEINIELCLEVANSFHSDYSHSEALTFDELKTRVEWALEMGLDEVFEIPTELERKSNGCSLLPEELTCILKLLSLSKQDFQSHKSKEKLPKPKLNNLEIILLAQHLIDRRLKDYLTSVDEDDQLLNELYRKPQKNTSDYRKIKAIIVRKSEKEILFSVKNNLIQKLQSKQNEMK